MNRLHYDNGFWPTNITSDTSDVTLAFLEEHVSLIALPLQRDDYKPMVNANVTPEGSKPLADTTTRIWNAIQSRDLSAWGQATMDSFNVQVAMFPNMVTLEMTQVIDSLKGIAYGWKITGGGGCLVAITEKPFEDAISVNAVRK